MANAQPKCPLCGMLGLDSIVYADSKAHSQGGDPWFNVAYCDECGYIYGVFAKHVLNHEMKFVPNLPFVPPTRGP